MQSMLTPRPEAISLPQYMLKARETLRFKDTPQGLESVRFGFFGEVGGLLAAVKKAGRDKLEITTSEAAGEELGDALWYLFIIAHFMKVSPDELGNQCLANLRERFAESSQPSSGTVTFRHIDGLIDAHATPESFDRSRELGKLALSAGLLAELQHAQQLAVMPSPQRVQLLGSNLAQLAVCCATFSLSVEKVAAANIAKTFSRWPGDDNFVYPPLFDDGYYEHEQFPRNDFTIDFIERGEDDKRYVVQRMNGVYIGDRLTDNHNEPDFYRFHDVFHLAYVAYLGWSPVLRGLLKRKRKSRPKVDENEDGARAMIIEEGIATWIFNHAKERGYYENVEQGSLDYGLLKQISSMVQGYEVDQCRLWQWELAILEGFKAFRQLRESRGGRISVDVEQHTFVFEELQEETNEPK